jgi:MFS family permease
MKDLLGGGASAAIVLLRGAGAEVLGLRAGGDEHRRNVRRVAIARLVSQAGSQAAVVALLALVYERTHGSGVWLAAIFLSSFVVVVIVFGPLVGMIGDRFDRRTVMIVSDLAAAAAFVGLAFANDPFALLGLSICAAAAQAPFTPAANAQLLMLVPEEMQVWATSVRSTAQWTGVLIGGIAGGILVAAVGAPATFLLNALTFLVSVALVLRISGGSYRAAHSLAQEHHGVWAGIRSLARQPTLRLSCASVCLGVFGAGMMTVAEYPLFVHLGGGSIAYGAGIASWGIGGVVGGHNARRRRDAGRQRDVLVWSQAILALGEIACGIVPSASAVVILFAPAAFGYAAATTAFALIVQRSTADAVRARVFAATDGLCAGALGVALAASGAALPALGPAGVFVCGGTITLAAVLVATRVPRSTRS